MIAFFSDYLCTKARTTVREESIEHVRSLIDQARAMQREAIVVGFGDPRWVAQLPFTVPVLAAWSGDRVMQQAAARALLKVRKA